MFPFCLGASGIGKSTMATQSLFTKYMYYLPDAAGDVSTIIYRKLTCTSLNHFYSDLAEFYHEKEKLQNSSQHRNKKWELLLTLYKDMNTHYPEFCKLFILDDAEDIEAVLEMLNHICFILTPNVRRFWKILVTTQKQPRVSRDSKIQEKNFLTISGFTLENTREFFNTWQFTEATVEKIHRALGSSPLAMTICRKGLESYQVNQAI